MKLIFRDAVEKDLNYIYELEKKIFGSDAYQITYLHYLLLNSEFFKVACIDSVIVGYIVGRVEGVRAHLITIAVDKGYRGRGIGRYMLKCFIDYTLDRGVKTIYLEVSTKRREAINFYKRHGFKEKGYIPRYYTDGSDAIVMEKNIGTNLSK